MQANRVVQADDSTGSKGSTKEGVWKIGNWYSSSETVPAICGVNRVWVAHNYRRQKIASRIIDCLRYSSFSYMCVYVFKDSNGTQLRLMFVFLNIIESLLLGLGDIEILRYHQFIFAICICMCIQNLETNGLVLQLNEINLLDASYNILLIYVNYNHIKLYRVQCFKKISFFIYIKWERL